MLGLPVVCQYPFPLRLIPLQSHTVGVIAACAAVMCTEQCRMVWPCSPYLILFAGVHVGHGLAPPAAHIAAPDKLAFTPFHMPDNVGVVPAPTAEEVAAIGSVRGAVTFPSLSPRDPQFLVFDTVIGRFVHIQQVFFPDWYFSLAFFFPA